MAEIFTSVAVSPSGSTLLNALQGTTAAGTVLNEVVSVGDPINFAAVGGVIASTNAPFAQVVEPGGAFPQAVTGTFFPATQTVTGAVTTTGTVTAVQATASALQVTAVQSTAASLNATILGTVTANAGTGTLAVSAASLPMALGAGTLSYGQVVITTSATQIIAASATRKFLIVSVLNNGPNLFLGDASVATNTGLLLLGIQGAAPSVPTTAALYAIAAGTATSNAVSYLEGHA